MCRAHEGKICYILVLKKNSSWASVFLICKATGGRKGICEPIGYWRTLGCLNKIKQNSTSGYHKI